jgi:hypothetical protein
MNDHFRTVLRESVAERAFEAVSTDVQRTGRFAQPEPEHLLRFC